jgi:polar amino acid transport system substrate-binding protein
VIGAAGVGPRAVPVLFLAALVLGACGSDDDGEGPGGSDAAADKLAQVEERRTLILSTDLDYAPQSFEVASADRLGDTRCDEAHLTGPQVSGYDAEVGKAVARELGVEPCFVAPTWIEITSGSWGDRWDLAFGSGAIDSLRMEQLYVTQPYYVLPARLFVPDDSRARTPDDLSGGTVGACAACTHESYLLGALELPGYDGTQRVVDAEVVAYTVEGPGLRAAAHGDIDAFLCAEQVGRRAIDDGLGLREIEDTLFVEHATGWIDKSSELDVRSFVDRIDRAVRDLHADGTLADLSVEFFGVDYATDAGAFDMATITQEVS